jgi:NADPH2:quinone reductase
MGAYCEARNYPADKLLKLPEEISDEVAATVMLKGMTAEYLANRTAHLSPGDPILIHAAAGGTGLLLSQWAKHLGATVIGTVGSEEKAELAKAHGCDHVILYRSEDVAKRVMEITDGAGVKVSYDSVGKDTFQATLDALAPMGMFVSFGQASGPITPFVPAVLAPKCLYFTRPTLFVYNRTRQLLEASVGRLFEILSSGVVKSEVRQTYALQDAAQAHRDLEGRQTQGATVLKP